MAVNFTTWQDLYAAMLNALADCVATGRFQSLSYGIAGRNMTYRSMEEFQRGIEWVKFLADNEQGRAVGRTHAKPVGRFPETDENS